MFRTINFSIETDPKIACTCGHPDCDRRVINQFTLGKLQRVRDDINKPLYITSGGRCPNHPNEAHKSAPGDHQKGYGVDVACLSEAHETKLKVLAGRHGATRVAGGHEDGFVHMAWTPTDRRDVPTWSYK